MPANAEPQTLEEPRIGIVLRNMGPQAETNTLAAMAEAAERAGLDSIWVTDHVAIAPQESEGSNGRYFDPLATLAYLAAKTHRIQLGTAVLILPYRPRLPTAKWIATIQELSGGRLRLGVGVGWMDTEFRALGLARSSRGRVSDENLAFLHRCFDQDIVSENGQDFLFRPRPKRPPILVGGRAPHALRRAAQFADAWLPVRIEAEALAGHMHTLAEYAKEFSRLPPRISVMGPIPPADEGIEHVARYQRGGATEFLHTVAYADLDEGLRAIESLANLRRQL